MGSTGQVVVGAILLVALNALTPWALHLLSGGIGRTAVACPVAARRAWVRVDRVRAALAAFLPLRPRLRVLTCSDPSRGACAEQCLRGPAPLR